jgi:hypothetical protein
MEPRSLKFYYIIFFCLSSILFFAPAFIPLSLLYYTYYANFLITLLIVILNYKNSNTNVFSSPFILLLIAILISGLSATYAWGQSLIDSYQALTLYLSYILFFLLIIWKTWVRDIEKIILILGIIYIVVYTITFLLYPVLIFGDIEKYDASRGFQRIMLGGVGFLFLFSFYSLSQYLKKRQLLWLILIIISVICIIMLLTRTLLMVSFTLMTFFILRKSSFIKKILTILLIVSSIYIISQMNFFQLLVKQTIEESENKKDNIRVLAATYYLNDFSPNIFSKIFGNGQAYKESRYDINREHLEKELGYYQSDLGYIGLYSKFGVLAILAYLILIYNTYKVAIPDEYLYCKYYLYFIFIISIIIDAPFNPSYITSIVFATYVLNSKNLIRINNNIRVSKNALSYNKKPSFSMTQNINIFQNKRK